MNDDPLPSPDSGSSGQVVRPANRASFVATVLSGVRTGAKYGSAIVGGLAFLVGSTVLVIAYGFTQQKESIGVAILGVSLGVIAYAIAGAVVGAVIMGVVAGSRFKGRSRLQTIRVVVALALLVAVGSAVGFTIYWCTLPGMTTENHVFVFLNLCQEDKYADATRYLERHPEIATDKRAMNRGPALNAVACFNYDLRVSQLLLDHGADVNATDKFGTTALEDAINNGHLKVARLLLEHRRETWAALQCARCERIESSNRKATNEKCPGSG